MGNNWMIPRNKRRLYPVVDILSLFTLHDTGVEWGRNIDHQRNFESELERFGLKRAGDRRDGRAGGARTYEAWLDILGLIYKDTNRGLIRTTLAGEALLNGEPPVPIITNQLMKMQYPSPYSVRGNVSINSRFRIRPFRFILRLLSDDRIGYLHTPEIAYVVITRGENETEACFEDVVEGILDFRSRGLDSLPNNFNELYPSRLGVTPLSKTLSRLHDIANTVVNFLDYTQLISRLGLGTSDSRIALVPSAIETVNSILSDGTSLRPFRPNQESGKEIFQRNFGLAPGQNRDNRNFAAGQVPVNLYRNRRVRSELLHIFSIRPVVNIDIDLLNEISSITGYSINEVEEALHGFQLNPLDQFEANYLDMSISGRDRATEFEIATKEIFEELGFRAQHVGMNPLHPDVVVESPLSFSGIIDTKAISRYTPSNDHRNRMISNYIPSYRAQYANLECFMYVADSFSPSYTNGLQTISASTRLAGSGITASNLLVLLQRHLTSPINHDSYRSLFKSNSVISLADIQSL